MGWRDNIVQLDVQVGNADAPTLNVFRDGIKAYTFFAGEMSEAFANFHIDHDYAPGTALYPHVHWAIASTETGTVRWGVEWTYAKGHGQMAFGPTQTVYVEQAADGTGLQALCGRGVGRQRHTRHGHRDGRHCDVPVLPRWRTPQ
jgi:hypothetical protein